MIVQLEAYNYRCLRAVQQGLGRFHVLIGRNASGKSTFNVETAEQTSLFERPDVTTLQDGLFPRRDPKGWKRALRSAGGEADVEALAPLDREGNPLTLGDLMAWEVL